MSSLCRASFFWCEAPPTRVWRLEGLASRSFLPPSSSLCSPLPPCRRPVSPPSRCLLFSFFLSLCLFLALSFFFFLFSLSGCLPACGSSCHSVCRCVFLSVSVCLSGHLSVYLLFVCSSVRSSLLSPVRLSVFLLFLFSLSLSSLSLSFSFLHALGQTVYLYSLRRWIGHDVIYLHF